MVTVIWTEQAIDDLTAIADYTSHHSEKWASAVIQRLFNRVSILKEMPELGRIVPEKGDASIRELIEGNYRIIYEIKHPDRVEILLIHHSSRPLDNP
ncbi:type II toxin-antitoxin system RelE/ParE family toxin [Cesiribacter andamanensis]|uniref:type II toxin-antitoxin system RelE/ParE family toxin n=1 Tax=Cesiribacter andamanensis TaxID=649507 RepID=UPI00058D752A|nr:type II toxin-antitoxin system RelE/ParE family toxin [Cesiribacter andamanensis]